MAQRPSLSRGTMIVLGAGALLLLDTFFDWQRACVLNFCASRNAWHGFWGVFLGLLTLALLVWMGLQIARVQMGTLPLSPAQITAALAAVIFVFAVMKNLVDDFSAWASYLGIVLAAGVAVGAAIRLQEEGLLGAAGGPFAARGRGPGAPPPTAPLEPAAASSPPVAPAAPPPAAAAPPPPPPAAAPPPPPPAPAPPPAAAPPPPAAGPPPPAPAAAPPPPYAPSPPPAASSQPPPAPAAGPPPQAPADSPPAAEPEAVDAVTLTIESGPAAGQTAQVTGDSFVLGRENSCDLVLDDEQASRRHAEIVRQGGRVWVQDLQSTNGTQLDGARITEPVELRGGEVITIGSTRVLASLGRGERTVVRRRPS